MIDIKLFDTKIILKGHAGYGEKGKDIVCAAVSILIDTFVLKNFNDLNLITENDYLEIGFKKPISDLGFVRKGLEYIEDAYPENINLKVFQNILE